jgi:hypothetical protein
MPDEYIMANTEANRERMILSQDFADIGDFQLDAVEAVARLEIGLDQEGDDRGYDDGQADDHVPVVHEETDDVAISSLVWVGMSWPMLRMKPAILGTR